MFYDLKQEITAMEKTYVIAGKVFNNSSVKRPIIVVLFSETEEQGRLVDFSLAEELRQLTFWVAESSYYLGTFIDDNQNPSYDSGEFSSYYGSPTKITFLPPTKNK